MWWTPQAPAASQYCAWCQLQKTSMAVIRNDRNYGLDGGWLTSRIPICRECAETHGFEIREAA